MRGMGHNFRNLPLAILTSFDVLLRRRVRWVAGAFDQQRLYGVEVEPIARRSPTRSATHARIAHHTTWRRSLTRGPSILQIAGYDASRTD